MKKTLTITLLALAITAKAQTKKYAEADPKKAYTFTLIIPAVKLGDLQQLAIFGTSAIMDSNIPAKDVKAITNNSANIINELLGQLRKQIVADSLSNLKKGAGRP